MLVHYNFCFYSSIFYQTVCLYLILRCLGKNKSDTKRSDYGKQAMSALEITSLQVLLTVLSQHMRTSEECG